jgi:hypothetical protein
MGAILQQELLLPTARRYGAGLPHVLKRWFPDSRLPLTGSDKFAWDIERPTLEDTDAYGVAGGKPVTISPEEVAMGHARLPGLSFERALNERELLYERMPGLPDAGTVEAKLQKDIGLLIARIERRKEVERAKALTGTLTYKVNGGDVTVDMAIPSANKEFCSASWATAGTDIIGDINGWAEIFAASCGFAARYLLVNRTALTYLLGNTALKSWAAAMNSRFSDDLITNGVPFPILGVNLLLVDGKYVTGGVSTPFIANGYASLLPDPAECTPGEEVLGPAMANGAVTWGLVAERKELDVDDVKAIVKKNSLNILTRPDAVMYCNLTATS